MPRAPARLVLPIEREWNGEACEDARLHGRVELQARPEGLHVAAALQDPGPPHVPDSPPGSRVADLWHYDVVECFLVGSAGRYLEVELGADGRFLVLSFDAPRVRCDDHETLTPELDHSRNAAGWHTEILLPWQLVPEDLRALNAFVSARGRHLAHHPLPGAAPDFHQPDAFPSAELAREP